MDTVHRPRRYCRYYYVVLLLVDRRVVMTYFKYAFMSKLYSHKVKHENEDCNLCQTTYVIIRTA